MMKAKWMRWTGHVAHMGIMKNVYKILVGKHEGKMSLGRSRFTRENTIKMEGKGRVVPVL